MARQQYHRLESGGNPSLKTLELIAAGLDLAVMLIPKEKLNAVKSLLAGAALEFPAQENSQRATRQPENPWKEFLEEDGDD